MKPRSSRSFYDDIKNAKLSEDGRVLRFPNGLSPGGFIRFPAEIYIRKTDEDLYAVIKKKRDGGATHFVVTGTEGIGKSIFALYCMWRYLNEEESDFVYETSAYLLDRYSSGSVESGDTSILSPGLPYFVDIFQVKLPQAMNNNRPKFIIIFSDPNRERYKAFLKIPGSQQYVMPIWTEEEIFHAHTAITEFKKIPLSTIKEQLRFYGPIPRYVFEKESTLGKKMQYEISSRGRQAAENMFHGDHPSYMLMHMHESRKNSRKPASDYVVEQLVEKYQKEVQKSFLWWLSILRSRYDDCYDSDRCEPASASIFFKKLCILKKLPRKEYDISPLSGEVTYKKRKFDASVERLKYVSSANLNTVSISIGPSEKLLDVFYDESDESDKSWSPKDNVLYLPPRPNEKSVDCFMRSGDDLYLFLVTIEVTHPVEADGLQTIYTRCGGTVDAKGKCNLRCHLIFVVHQSSQRSEYCSSMLNKIQPLQEKGINLINRPKKDLHQFAAMQWLLKIPEQVWYELED